MNTTHRGSIRLFRFAGIDVFVHWTWIVVAFLLFEWRWEAGERLWQAAIYVSIFAIVLLHEFGHALACRSVGGRADTIVLWPLGGIAFVQPPHRPGAWLWSIAAGPLVNVALVPILYLCLMYLGLPEDPASRSPLQNYVFALNLINAVLLGFNLLPIYPLDGGQIVQSILWFFLGFARSLWVAALLGLGCGLAGIAVAGYFQDWWLVLIALFVAWRSWEGLIMAREMIRHPSNPRGPVT